MKALQQNRLLTVLIIVWYMVGIFGFLVPQARGWFQQLTPEG
jgi:hypothetical protein